MGYYRNYHRPYYRRRRRSFNPKNAGIALLALFVIGIMINIKEFIASPLFYILLAIGAYFIIKKIWWGKKSDNLHDGGDVADINSEKHGCKCYMEGLSDGEQEVAHLLSQELSYKDCFLFNNIILHSENNSSTQIDHIVVSKYGIFVIESKDYQGWIFGDKDQATWTQLLPGGNNKFQFQNPIHQNYAHIMALKTLMPFVNDNFYSIVVFSNKSEFKTAMPENVVNFNGLIGYIKKYAQDKLTDDNFQLAIGRLSFLCQTTDISAAEHIANLHKNQRIIER